MMKNIILALLSACALAVASDIEFQLNPTVAQYYKHVRSAWDRKQITEINFDRARYNAANFINDSMIPITFRYYTRNTGLAKSQTFGQQDLRQLTTSFDAKKQTKVLVPGFLEQSVIQNNWVNSTIKALFEHDDYNIFYMDWTATNMFPYEQSVNVTRIAAHHLAHVIRSLMATKQANPSRFHCIGLDLGANVCAQAGTILRQIDATQRLGRITGLNPAITSSLNATGHLDLKKEDAWHVDTIVTSKDSPILDGIANASSIGHLNFLVNNGDQPNKCEKNPLQVTILLPIESKQFSASGAFKDKVIHLKNGKQYRIVTYDYCKNILAAQLWLKSIQDDILTRRSLRVKHAPKQNCTLVGFTCPSWPEFASGRCSECQSRDGKCPVLGITADQYKSTNSNPVNAYLRTKTEESFCQFYYTVDVEMAKQPAFKEDAKVMLTVKGEFGQEQVPLEYGEYIKYQNGESYKSTLVLNKYLGKLRCVTLKWTKKSDILTPVRDLLSTSRIYVGKITFREMFNNDNAEHYQFRSVKALMGGVDKSETMEFTGKLGDKC